MFGIHIGIEKRISLSVHFPGESPSGFRTEAVLFLRLRDSRVSRQCLLARRREYGSQVWMHTDYSPQTWTFRTCHLE
jgi:hypothetical protein